jgi:predicted ATPase
LRQSANIEAINYLSRALELLKTLPATAERTQKEIVLHVALTGPLMTIKGYGAPEAVQAFEQAHRLVNQTEDSNQLFPLLYGKWVTHQIKAEYQAAREVAGQFLDLAKQQPDTGMLMMGHRILGFSLGFLDELQSSRNCYERALALYDPQAHESLTFRFGQNPIVAIHGPLAWYLWLLGYPDQALNSLKEAIHMAREADHAGTLGYVLALSAGGLYQFRRDIEGLAEHARMAIEIAEQQGLALWLAFATVYEGWTMVERGQPEAGVAQMLKGLTDTQATGTKLSLTSLWAMLAEGYAALGQTQEGLKIIDKALAFVEDTDERYWEAELHRLKGELLLMQAAEAEAEANFQQAIDISRRRSSKSLELRATVSLARLWQDQGKTEEARQMLAEIYDWFTEGFDTVDLKEAKEFLGEG